MKNIRITLKKCESEELEDLVMVRSQFDFYLITMDELTSLDRQAVITEEEMKALWEGFTVTALIPENLIADIIQPNSCEVFEKELGEWYERR